jgi:hypothetical protein
MHPTLNKAVWNWTQLCKNHESLIKEARRNPLSVKFINGDIWYFRTEAEGAKAYRGYHADVVYIDDFPLNEKLGEVFVKEQENDSCYIDES